MRRTANSNPIDRNDVESANVKPPPQHFFPPTIPRKKRVTNRRVGAGVGNSWNGISHMLNPKNARRRRKPGSSSEAVVFLRVCLSIMAIVFACHVLVHHLSSKTQPITDDEEEVHERRHRREKSKQPPGHSPQTIATVAEPDRTTTTEAASDAATIAKNAKASMAKARESWETQFRPLQRPLDFDKYTVRINTWRRNEQLLLSVNHLTSCEGVAQVQVVWCHDAEGIHGEPPPELRNHPSGKVVVERHEENSLNERFRVLQTPPTLGILSIDDDVLRPCIAMDAGFFKWTDNPTRIVGYDGRLHMPVAGLEKKTSLEEQYKTAASWIYGYKSSTEKYNLYSLILPRYCFVHVDYLQLYTDFVPRPIYDRVSRQFNCEDIAFSFFVSALTQGKLPLLADYWAVQSIIKLYSPHMISMESKHKSERDDCVNDFAEWMGLKDNPWHFRPSHMWHKDEKKENNVMFAFGVLDTDDNNEKEPSVSQRRLDHDAKMKRWSQQSSKVMWNGVQNLVQHSSQRAREAGLIEKTEEWKARWGQANEKEKNKKKDKQNAKKTLVEKARQEAPPNAKKKKDKKMDKKQLQNHAKHDVEDDDDD